MLAWKPAALVTLALGILVLAPRSAGAQDPYELPPRGVPGRLGPEFQVNVHTPLDQVSPDVAVAGLGDAVVVWYSETQPSGAGGALFARRYDYSGNPLGGDLAVNASAPPGFGRVALAADGRFVVAWAAGALGVYARCFDGLGAAVAAPVRLDGGGLVGSGRPEVVLLGAGAALDGSGAIEALVAWPEQGAAGGAVRTRRLGLDCALGESALVAERAQVADVGLATLVPDGWVVAWSGRTTAAEAPRIWARPFSGDGGAPAGEIFVDSDAEWQGGWLHSPVPLAREDGGFGVVWGSLGIGEPRRPGIFARSFAADFAGGPVARLSADPGAWAPVADRLLEVTLVVWTSNGDVVGRLFDAQWSPRGAEFPVNEHAPDEQELPAIAAAARATPEGVPYGSWLAVWGSGIYPFGGVPPGGEGQDTQDGSYFGIIGQRFAVECTLAQTETLCLASQFQVRVSYRLPDGTRGRGQAVQLTADTGAFWFFDAANPELIVKIVDGRAVNGKFWVFYAALSDVEYDLEVVHRALFGATRVYHNPQGTLAAVADTETFYDCSNCARAPAASAPPEVRAGVLALPVVAEPAPSHPPVLCTGTATDLCLRDGRFSASVAWRALGTAGAGHAVRLSDAGGYFWFFARDNVELVVKVLDGSAVNGHQWVFYAALTDVDFTLTIIDVIDGHAVRTYHNPAGTLASRADTEAF